MLLADWQINQLCQGEQHLIYPFFNSQQRGEQKTKISYGLSSFGYDCRLSPTSFKLFLQTENRLEVDPKDFQENLLTELPLYLSEKGNYFLMPAHSYGLGLTTEYFNIPPNITGIALGKSTYARAGLVVNTTPLEAGWKGRLVIELANTTSLPLRVYTNEGIIQILFFTGEEALISYADRNGKYQYQQEIVTAKL